MRHHKDVTPEVTVYCIHHGEGSHEQVLQVPLLTQDLLRNNRSGRYIAAMLLRLARIALRARLLAVQASTSYRPGAPVTAPGVLQEMQVMPQHGTVQ